MPAIDNCEPQIVRAMQKAGWQVTDQPFSIRWRTGYIYADLRMKQTHDDEVVIIIEVKCFPEKRSTLSDFYQAVGQYILYRQVVKNELIYLALPKVAYDDFFKQNDIQTILHDNKINVIVVNLADEVVSQWIKW